MAASTTLADEIIESVSSVTFPELLTILHARKYSGPVTFHCINGVPTVAEFPRKDAVRLPLVTPPRAP